jgi:hypothetical protein
MSKLVEKWSQLRISCTYGMLLCLSRPQRAAYLLADVLGLTDTDGAEILDCTREAFRQRVSRARRTLRQVIDNRCGLIDPANPCQCGRQIASSEAAGILSRDHLPLARHTREEVRVWIEPVAKQLDSVVAIGDLYRFDRFAARSCAAPTSGLVGAADQGVRPPARAGST